MRYLFLLLTLCCAQILKAQTCTGCKTTYNNYTEDIRVKNNEVVCITGTYSGSIEFNGGVLQICGNAQINELNYKQPASMILNPGSIVKIQNINSNKEVFITNNSDSFIIQGGNFNTPFKLINNGKCTINGGNFNSELEFNNSGDLIFNTGLNMNKNYKITNSKLFQINGNVNLNSGVLTFNSACQFLVNGDMNINGQTLNINGGYFKANNVNINSGSIYLKNGSVFYVNNMNVNGLIQGVGERAIVLCNQNPNLNSRPAINGNTSLCVKSGTYSPPAGALGDSVSLDCSMPATLTNCNPNGFRGYLQFRLKPQVATDWLLHTNWEVWDGTKWIASMQGLYPKEGASVLIDSNKQISINTSVLINKLVLGNNASAAKIIVPANSTYSISVIDTLELKGTSSIELNSGKLVVSGKLLSDLRIKGSAKSTVELNLKGGNRSLIMNQTASVESNILQSLTYNMNGDTLQLSDTLKIKSQLNPTGGMLDTKDKLIMLSDKNFTAIVNKGTGNYITGKVRVQRYIPSIGDRRFRFVSPVVSNSNLKDWQGEIFITGNNAATNATGNTIGTFNSAGFDATQSNQPTIYLYNETLTGSLNNGWEALTNETNTLADVPLLATRGYRMFIRGDRSDLGRLDGTNNFQNAVTLDMFGNLNTGNLNVPVSYTSTGNIDNDGWNLIGNPYNCAIDWKKAYNDGLSNKFEPSVWIYDANKNSYVSYNVISQAGSLANGYIPAGQSFWVKAIAVNPVITLKEEYKSTTTSGNVYRSVGEEAPTNEFSTDQLSIKIIKDSINEDEMILKYVNGANNGIDTFDVIKFWSTEVGIAHYIASENKYLDLSCRPINYSDADFVPLYFFVNASGNYKLKMKMSVGHYYPYAQAYLLDAFTKEYIDIRSQPEYEFTVDLANSATVEYDRFYIVYFPSTPPVSSLNYFFAVLNDSKTIDLSFGSLSEPAPTTYYVQRGYSSNTLHTIATINGLGGLDIASDYELIDSTADLTRDLYYRVMVVDTIHKDPSYSQIAQFNFDKTGLAYLPFSERLIVYPIPATDVLNIDYKDNGFHGGINVVITDIMGKQWIQSNITEPQPGGTLSLPIAALKAGLYFMEVTNLKGETANIKLLKN